MYRHTRTFTRVNGYVVGSTQRTGSVIDVIITRCAYAQGRVKRLSPSILYICMCVCGGKKHGCLLSSVPLENRHEIALYRSASQFIFFERCLESRKSLLSSAMAMGSNRARGLDSRRR